MRTSVLVLGWALAMALAIVAAVQADRARDARDEALNAADQLAAARASVDELATRVDDISGQMDDLLIELNELESAKAQVDVANRTPAETGVNVEDAAPGSHTDDVATDGAPKRKNPFATMFGGVMTDEMVEQTAKLSTEQQYGDLIAEWAFDEGRANEVREVFTRVLTEQTRSALDDTDTARSGNGDRLRDELVQVLTAEELAEFDQYQAVLPEKILRQQYAVQLGTYAAQLSEEDRTLALDVLVEESLAIQTGDNDPGENSAAMFERQFAVFDNTAARLAEVFDADQMAPIDRLLDQQRAAIDMVMRMMENDDDEDSPSPR